jgi:activator of HSP90 ATPase
MLRGYKKTSDGRTTSYFTREQTEKEKELIGCIKPKRLESTVSESGASTEQQQSTIGSVWNQAGTTWEEKDTTDWCKSCLKECLLDSMAVHTSECESVTYVAQVKGVDALTGDASVALAGGKKRYIYDFHTDIKYEISNENGCIASGSLKLPDINSAHTAEEELEVEILKWKKSPNEDCEINGAETCRTLLVMEIRKSVLKFVEKFNHSF